MMLMQTLCVQGNEWCLQTRPCFLLVRFTVQSLCQGKSPREQLWHFTAAPSPRVITLLAFLLLSGQEEQPSELSSREMSWHGPTTLPRGLPGMGIGAFPPGVLLHPESAVTWAASCPVHCDVSLKAGMLQGSP